MEKILALDFDGTLYRLVDDDSEEMLIKVASLTEEERRLAAYATGRQRSGHPHEFEEILRDLLRGKPLDVIEKTVDMIMPLTDMEEIEVLKRIAAREDVHMHLVSCGTDMIVRSFLKRTGLLPYTEGIHAKELLHDEQTFIDFIWHIEGPEDKKRTVERLRDLHENSYLVSVGDGFTDGPMLSASEMGLLMEWPGGKHNEMPYRTIHSFTELEELISSIT